MVRVKNATHFAFMKLQLIGECYARDAGATERVINGSFGCDLGRRCDKSGAFYISRRFRDFLLIANAPSQCLSQAVLGRCERLVLGMSKGQCLREVGKRDDELAL